MTLTPGECVALYECFHVAVKLNSIRDILSNLLIWFRFCTDLMAHHGASRAFLHLINIYGHAVGAYLLHSVIDLCVCLEWDLKLI